MTESLLPSAVPAGDAQALEASLDAEDSLERLAEDLLTDTCHRLRRACQIADYGVPGASGMLDSSGSPK